MSFYCGQSDIINYIDNTNLIGMTDDFNTGFLNTGILNNVITMASNKADAMVSSIYGPFGPTPPAKIKDATIIFACYALYARRLTPEEKNPFKEQNKFWEDTLTKINAGMLSLDESFNRGFTPVVSDVSRNRVNTNFY